MNRRLLAGVGVAVALVGFALLLMPGVAASLATGRSVLYGVAALAFLYALSVADDRGKAEIEGHDTDEPETVQSLPAPGVEFRERMDHVRKRSDFENQRLHQTVTEELEDIAVAVVSRREGCSPAEARRMLERGTWTDDPVAAEFFTTGGLRMSTAELLKEVAGRRRPFSEEVERVVDELVALWDADDGLGRRSS